MKCPLTHRSVDNSLPAISTMVLNFFLFFYLQYIKVKTSLHTIFLKQSTEQCYLQKNDFIQQKEYLHNLKKVQKDGFCLFNDLPI